MDQHKRMSIRVTSLINLRRDWLQLLSYPRRQLHGYKSCIVKERKALLELKEYMVSRTYESYLDYVLPTWTNDTKSDCCQWDGIDCNLTSRRVIGLSVGQSFYHQPLLNLSLLHPFEELRSLNLSTWTQVKYGSFNGFIDDVEGYKSLRKLKYLEILDLSSNAFDKSIFPFLNAVTSLTTLILHDNSVTDLSIKELKNLTNLELLDLSGNDFHGSIPALTHLKSLKALDLSTNYYSSSMGSMDLQDLKNLTNLEVLGLAENNLGGPIPIEVVCRMKNLRELDLKQNRFVGQLPLCFGSLKKLRVLDLSSNQLSGNLPSIFSRLESLEYLSLLDNNFTSLFSLNPLTNLTKLKVLKLSSTSHKVQVETGSTWHPNFQLRVVILRSCNLENIPSFLMYQKNLHLVDLSRNRLSGDIPTWLLANNSELKVLQLQEYSFTIFQIPSKVHNLQFLDFSANHIGGVFTNNIGRALPNLVEMNGSYNGFQGQLPSSIGEMKNLSLLDLSYNNFSKKLPRSVLTGCFSLKYLMLSHNKFTGNCLPRGTRFTSLLKLTIHNNLFTGKIGVGLLGSTRLSFLDMSNNRLTGAIPSWLSMLSVLEHLLLSNNLLEGTIPPSLVDLPYLSHLDLSGNILSGPLLSHMGVLYLFLHNNSFTGPIPDTLLEGLSILSLGYNKLSGSIPQFVNANDIRILLLRGNNLTGSIPRQLCHLSTIEVLDLSNNKLNGYVPSCLFNLSSGETEQEMFGALYGIFFNLERFKLDIYKFTFVVEELVVQYKTYGEIGIEFASKQRYESYTAGRLEYKGVLDYMYGMDLSNNELSGVIPTELGDLPKVKALNLSHNFLSSSIPSSFSKLTDIESLDLSYNMLHGSIPYQLNMLTFLEVFDVSHNNLSGIIPQGKQFNTFKESSYLDNPLLCGPPTDISCEAKNSTEEANNGGEEGNEAAIDMLIFYYTAASVYVTVLIGIVVLMCFDCPWRRAWLRVVDVFIVSAKHMMS
ncbi:Leucine-rich repeat [Arabidopsis thaliana x Arabidopsis arenosa]|uniref:Leucine-rich repeat n=1 Tax=Arabidopsis thaliana x Arabidopsis arenosa TaxID=1240361 RepID=A0A8T2A597_9BRAS|nr:Leucine-rich repeat [Arabidopsis thaliana x Arabidopsis arenosa]